MTFSATSISLAFLGLVSIVQACLKIDVRVEKRLLAATLGQLIDNERVVCYASGKRGDFTWLCPYVPGTSFQMTWDIEREEYIGHYGTPDGRYLFRIPRYFESRTHIGFRAANYGC